MRLQVKKKKLIEERLKDEVEELKAILTKKFAANVIIKK